MTQRPSDRFRLTQPGTRGSNPWISLGLLLLALLIVLLARQRLADSAASCYTTVTTPAPPQAEDSPQQDTPEPNVQVIPPPGQHSSGE